MSNPTTVVDAYFAMLNEADVAARARYIEQAWAEDCAYLDPQLEAKGHTSLSEMVSAIHERFPGFRFSRLSAVDQHHDRVRFSWDFRGPGGELAVAGLDVGTLAPDGRLATITGFFGDLAAA